MSKAKVNPLLPRTELKCCDGDYALCYTYRALVTAEKMLRASGYSKQESNLLTSMDTSDLDATQIGILLFAGLITHHPDMTMAKVEAELVTFENVRQLRQFIYVAYLLAMPKYAKTLEDKQDPSQPE